jgi:hypothetical protein
MKASHDLYFEWTDEHIANAPLEECVISPAAMFDSPLLETVD